MRRLSVLVFIVLGWLSSAQLCSGTWSYDFGSRTNSFTSVGTAPVTFLPTPESGVIRADNRQEGAAIYLENPGLINLGEGSELRIKASHTVSSSKVSLYNFSGSQVFYVKASVLLGSENGGNAYSGTFYLGIGNGKSFRDYGVFNWKDFFTIIKWELGSDGQITSGVRKDSNWATLDPAVFSQSYVYDVEIIGNNSISRSSYYLHDLHCSLDSNCQDVWVNGILTVQNLAKAAIDSKQINSLGFWGFNSTKNVGNIFVDDIVYSNELPQKQSPTLPVELSSFTAAISNDNKVNIMWTTESETNSLGFQVYRGTESNLEAARLISPLIPATNTSQTQSYIFRDADLNQSGTYYYWLESLDLDGQTDFHGPTALDVSLQQGNATPSIPLVEGISSIYPNPFNPSTGIKFCLEKEANARILIYNARGQIVRTLLDQRMPSGYHRETWDGTNELGQACGSGIYLIRLVVGERSFTSKAVLLK